MARVRIASTGPGVAWVVAGVAADVAPGASVTITVSGTTTPVTVWAGETGNGTLSQPLTTDAQGRLPGYVDSPQTVDISINGAPVVETEIVSSHDITPGGVVTATQQAGDYTFALSDLGQVVEGTSATGQTFTIPPGVLPIGALIEVYQAGVGQITFAPGAGVTIDSEGGKLKTAAQFATAGLRQRSLNVWALSGALA